MTELALKATKQRLTETHNREIIFEYLYPFPVVVYNYGCKKCYCETIKYLGICCVRTRIIVPTFIKFNSGLLDLHLSNLICCFLCCSFDRDWKKIEAYVGSKTVIQVLFTSTFSPLQLTLSYRNACDILT
jgi:hypothetical protein